MLKEAYNGQNTEHCVSWIIPLKIYPDFALRGRLGAGSNPPPTPPSSLYLPFLWMWIHYHSSRSACLVILHCVL